MRRGTWTRVVSVPGTEPPRQVEITYRWRAEGPDLPERERRHGIILAFAWPVFAGFSAFFGWIWIIDPRLGDFVGVFCVLFGLTALAYLVGARSLWRRGSRNLAGKHELVGRVLDRDTFLSNALEGYPFDVYFLAVDFGESQVLGWQVDAEVYQRFPVGTPVRVVLSGDREYLYDISPAVSAR